MKDIIKKILSNYNFSEEEKNQYEKYLLLLSDENKKYNLTRIESPEEMCYRHIIDSTSINQFDLLEKSEIILDIGSGCGVPGIVLAIQYPHKTFFLMEVNTKKINFLNLAIQHLNLTNTTVITDDFLSFVYNSNQKIDTFLARASLALKEIVKLYNNKPYQKSSIIYWAGPSWRLNSKHNIVLQDKKLKIEEFFYLLPKSLNESE